MKLRNILGSLVMITVIMSTGAEAKSFKNVVAILHCHLGKKEVKDIKFKVPGEDIHYAPDGGAWNYYEGKPPQIEGYICQEDTMVFGTIDTDNWTHEYDLDYQKLGWEENNNNWRYMFSNGSIAIGWNYLGYKWYYFDNMGVMLHDTSIDGYYLGSDGAWVQ